MRACVTPCSCINVEADRGNFMELERNLAPSSDVAIALPGEFADHVDDILEMIGNDPAPVCLDPFGLKGIEMKPMEKLLRRGGKTKTELLVHFSDKTFKRMAGNLTDNTARKAVGIESATSKAAQLDRVVGTPMWRRIWDSPLSIDEAMEKIAELYLSELRSRVGFADQDIVGDIAGRLERLQRRIVVGEADGKQEVAGRSGGTHGRLRSCWPRYGMAKPASSPLAAWA